MKRLFDFIVSFAALMLLLIPLAGIGILIAHRLGRPILFRQLRPGLNAKPFEIIKFRSMTNERDVSGNLLPDYNRITPFGKFLRATSIDELPELWNVLRGNMSLVGPRPLHMRYLDRYTPQQMRRHEVRPGITGWAQVNGRNSVNWEKRFEMDVWYVDNQSFFLDIKILFMTIFKVLSRSDIDSDSDTTMTEFMGLQSESKTSDALVNDGVGRETTEQTQQNGA